LPPKIILVAEDNPFVLKALCKMFEAEQDYEIWAEATNAEEAIQLANNTSPTESSSI